MVQLWMKSCFSEETFLQCPDVNYDAISCFSHWFKTLNWGLLLLDPLFWGIVAVKNSPQQISVENLLFETILYSLLFLDPIATWFEESIGGLFIQVIELIILADLLHVGSHFCLAYFLELLLHILNGVLLSWISEWLMDIAEKFMTKLPQNNS